ncbi:hypothetical protein ADICYQ_4226 [Cyclobacterium qasimii M12-11B]|uniref:Uncharacterized protein n=1 Tax=Cyclobacterium qasimii M12-11B TaxID=641524 RepID=S7WJA7_9BACT|nr:hypothetical protein ADICYQ_4226 [Cyclobacterium qasimii M12-11B]
MLKFILIGNKNVFFFPTSSSKSVFSLRYFSLASSILSFFTPSAVISASRTRLLAFSRASSSIFLLLFLIINPARTAPIKTPKAPDNIMYIEIPIDIFEFIYRIEWVTALLGRNKLQYIKAMTQDFG